MSQPTLRILEKLTCEARTNRRLDSLLRDPDTCESGNWYMNVPRGFNDALDIKFNVSSASPGWSQSACFSFRQSDVLYDSPKAYGAWGEALKELNLGVEILKASPAGQGGNGTWFPGHILLRIHITNGERTKLIPRGTYEMTQIDFVRFLIVGPDDQFASAIAKADGQLL